MSVKNIPGSIIKILNEGDINNINDKDLMVLNQWIDEDEKHREYLQEYLKLHYKHKIVAVNDNLNMDAAWDELISKKKSKKRIQLWSKVAGIAAMFIIVLGTLHMMFNQNSDNGLGERAEEEDNIILSLSNGEQYILEEKNQTISKHISFNREENELNYKASELEVITNSLYVPKGKTLKITLSDSTEVYINSDTKLTYPSHFAADKREVILEGEAFFDVKNNSRQSFHVITEEMKINVLGTSFNVNCYKDEDFVSTTLCEGKVALDYKGKTINLLPDQQLILDVNNNEHTLKKVNSEKYTAWINGRYHFQNTSLKKICNQLSRLYDVDFQFENKELEDKHFTLFFQNQDKLENILYSISKTKHISFIKKENTVFIKDSLVSRK